MKLQEKIKNVMEILKEEYPSHEKTTLNRMRDKPDAFKILISCLLSLRTRDKDTEKASNRLFAIAETPEQILSLSDSELENLIFSSGHYNMFQKFYWKSLMGVFPAQKKN